MSSRRGISSWSKVEHKKKKRKPGVRHRATLLTGSLPYILLTGFTKFCLIFKGNILYYANFTGNECETAKPLHLHCKNKNACLEFMLKNRPPTNQWNKIKCNPFRIGSRSRRCAFWCDFLASYYGASQKGKWSLKCSNKFRGYSRFSIPVPVGYIKVVPCWPFMKGVFIFRALTGKRTFFVYNV